MKFLFLIALGAVSYGKAAAQTTPARPAPPATMSAPNTARSDMSLAAKGAGPVSTDYSAGKKQQMRTGQSKTKADKARKPMSDGTGKMKTTM